MFNNTVSFKNECRYERRLAFKTPAEVMNYFRKRAVQVIRKSSQDPEVMLKVGFWLLLYFHGTLREQARFYASADDWLRPLKIREIK